MISKNMNPVNEFTPAFWKELSARIEQVAKETKGPKIAAFDADGTLWDADAGETFFDWQIHNCGLELPKDPWAHYLELKNPDPRVGYAWLAQINSGQSLTQVREWAKACFSEHRNWPVFESQRKLIEFLRSLDFEIFVVTASIKWAVEPVAGLLDIDYDHVLGITTKVENGIVGTEVVHPITWRDGKAEGLLARTSGVRPILASGNTYGDIALLNSATHFQLAVATQDSPCGLYDEECKLTEEAERRGWLRHKFRG